MGSWNTRINIIKRGIALCNKHWVSNLILKYNQFICVLPVIYPRHGARQL